MTARRRPLLLTADTDLLDDLLGMAAAVGVAVDVAADPGTCHQQWAAAPLVVVGSDLVRALRAARLGSRPGILLVARGSDDALQETGALIGAEDSIDLRSDETALLDRLADTAEPPGWARVIGVVPGRGGSGASVLAAALALTAARAAPAWLLDLDPLGGGADVGMGAELAGGARWADLGALAGRLSHIALRAAVPEILDTAVVAADARAGDPPPDTVRAVLAAARRGGGTVVVDLARHRTAARDEALAAVEDLIVVVPGEIRAVLATRRVLDGLGPSLATVRAAVRTVPGGLPPQEVVGALGLPLAGVLTDDPSVREALLFGDVGGLLRGSSLGAFCAHVLGEPARARRAA